MKNCLYLAFLFIGIFPARRQQLFMFVGSTNTTFDYHNSEGKTLGNLYPGSHFSYEAGYRQQVFKFLYATGSVVLNRYSSYGSDELYNNKYEWDTHYAGLALGLEGEFFKKHAFTLLARVAAEPQFLLQGTQTINNDVFSLKGVEEFNRPFLFARGGLGVNYCTDEYVVVTARYYYGYGFPIGNTTDTESLKLRTQTISIGIIVGLKRCQYCFSRRYR